MIEARRIAHIDGLRAIAVLSVVAYHVYERYLHVPQKGIFDLFARQGCHGVELFFVISGFCLSYPFLSRLRATGNARFDVARFAARRIVRIVPPYYAAIAALFGLVVVLARLHAFAPPELVAGAAPLQLLKQFTFVDGSTYFLNPSFWTLPIELRWYVFFPVALWLWTRSPRAFAAIMILALMAYSTRAGSLDLLVLPAFMLGIVAAHAYVHQPRIARFAPLLILPVAAFALTQTSHDEWGFISPFTEAAAFLFVVSAGAWPLMTGVLSLRLPAFIGRSSYSIYLVHYPLLGIAAHYGVYPLLAGGLAVAAGIGFWWVAERPFVETALRDRLIREFSFVGNWLTVLGIGTSYEATTRRVEKAAEAA